MATDHDARRRHIAEIAIDVIAAEGIGAATIRRIAAQARFSTAAVTHYFASKQDLLVWTFAVLSAQGDERFDQAFVEQPDDPVHALLTFTAWCPANVRRWRAYLAFWEAAARDESLAAIIRDATAAGIADIERLLRARHGVGHDLAKASRLLNSIVQGISLQAIVAPQDWPVEIIRATLAEGVEAALAAARLTAS
ncbi:TetR/AcrR family transcriptional regulator [Novosphingobium sp. JCM 18896]|uniref:TetR/AcrR family transcriptional regulator n=1 Tax=Novosphingobium sp. JCM 18896 TaxID=2989731 RepID=UPI0022213A94|nr:TetR/AcrR family transcriptional regulator [Novosphingobium sp. JCM 18896]MCW1428001.1 TetR/AcrR family transcriptional regulator [Novosphingobium sp. JCM 18896]